VGSKPFNPFRAEQIDKVISAEPSFAGNCTQRYVVCSLPRTGSGLLVHGLAATGVAGKPSEFLNEKFLAAYARRLGLPPLPTEDYWRFFEARRTTPNGVFGAKIHFGQLAAVARTAQEQIALLQRFDRLVHISRRDKIAQAVSWEKARQTDAYSMGLQKQLANPISPTYDAARIAGRLTAIQQGEQQWEEIFQRLGCSPQRVVYEDFVADYAGTIRRTLQALDLSVPEGDLRPQRERQADAINEEWIARFSRAFSSAG
jgi:LPS sulfotransferase NodH